MVYCRKLGMYVHGMKMKRLVCLKIGCRNIISDKRAGVRGMPICKLQMTNHDYRTVARYDSLIKELLKMAVDKANKENN